MNGCLRRLRCLGDDSLIKTIAHSSMENAKQACLYAMMKQYRLVWEYMITVIGAKFREQDFSYGRIDLNAFFMRIQDEDFLKGNGLSNEANIHIFCYDPADAMAVRYFTEQLVSDQDINCNVKEKNLYEIFLKLCADNRFLDKIPGLEKSKGAGFILKNLQGRTASAKMVFRREMFC